MEWKSAVKHAIPAPLLNNILLAWPRLYATRLVNYETTLSRAGVADLLTQLQTVLMLDGNLIECGSSRCGASIIMANFLQSRGSRKSIFACDSFTGFDLAELNRERPRD